MGTLTVYDFEPLSLTFSFLASPFTATFSVSNTDRAEDLTIYTESTHPDEISLPPVVIPANEQSVTIPFAFGEDSIPEGPHYGTLIAVPPAGYVGERNSRTFILSDDGVNTLVPAADGRATDADQDGVDFEIFEEQLPALLAVSRLIAFPSLVSRRMT